MSIGLIGASRSARYHISVECETSSGSTGGVTSVTIDVMVRGIREEASRTSGAKCVSEVGARGTDLVATRKHTRSHSTISGAGRARVKSGQEGARLAGIAHIVSQAQSAAGDCAWNVHTDFKVLSVLHLHFTRRARLTAVVTTVSQTTCNTVPFSETRHASEWCGVVIVCAIRTSIADVVSLTVVTIDNIARHSVTLKRLQIRHNDACRRNGEQAHHTQQAETVHGDKPVGR